MAFLLGTQSSHPKGDAALFWNCLNLRVDQAPNSSINISVIYPLCYDCNQTHPCQDTHLACSLGLASHQTGKCRVSPRMLPVVFINNILTQDSHEGAKMKNVKGNLKKRAGRITSESPRDFFELGDPDMAAATIGWAHCGEDERQSNL